MTVEQTEFEGLLLLTPQVFEDDRGYFFESYNAEKFRKATGLDVDFAQDNESRSAKGVIRGLHFQIPPHAQAKLVRVTEGKVLDVVVDLRKDQPTYGRSFAAELSAENKKMMFIPEGFAHGFAVLEDDTIFSYKCSKIYSQSHDRTLHYADPHFGIQWPIDDPRVSPKDQQAPTFSSFDSPF